MVALCVLVGEGEARQLGIVVAVGTLRVGDEQLLARLHLAVVEVTHLHVLAAEHIVPPVGHRHGQWPCVGFEGARLLDAVVLLYASDVGRAALVARVYLVRASAIGQLLDAEGVYEYQDGCTVGLRQVHLILLRAAAASDGVSDECLVGCNKEVGRHVIDGERRTLQPGTEAAERPCCAVAVRSHARGGIAALHGQQLQAPGRRELRTLKDAQEMVLYVVRCRLIAEVTLAVDDLCRLRGAAARHHQLHRLPLVGIGLHHVA